MSAGHTPGPWGIREASPNWEIFGDNQSRWVAFAPKAVSDENRDGTFYPSLAETADNARLIAAAPDLLSELSACADELRGAASALAKAGLHDAAKFADQREERARAALSKALTTGDAK